MGRADYIEAINKTEDEQMLLSVVRGRYGETFSLLTVSGVAANVRFKANAGIEAGIGPDTNYDGNLVPFSGGVAYEENPTITYVPVEGERYLRQLLSPISLDILVLLIRTGSFSGTTLTLLANRINGLRNPDFLDTSSTEVDPRFQRFVELNTELDQAGMLHWLEHPEKDHFELFITGYAPAYSEKVHEYLTLLELPLPKDPSKDIVLPVYLGIKGQGWSGVAISTRSTFSLIQILRAAVEIPKEHADAQLPVCYPRMGLAGKDIRIHASKDEPKHAAVAVKYRGHWFYVDETDRPTKLFYAAVRTLWSISISGAADQRAPPLLTIPVTR
jgi:hypothetical protein